MGGYFRWPYEIQHETALGPLSPDTLSHAVLSEATTTEPPTIPTALTLGKGSFLTLLAKQLNPVISWEEVDTVHLSPIKQSI